MKSKSPREYRLTSTLERSTNKLWGCHFIVPERVTAGLFEGKSRRVLCSLNGAKEHQCALIAHGNGSFVITVNKKRRDTLGITFGMKIRVTLRKDESEYGLPMPDELREVLRQDVAANKLFHSLTRGKQRVLLYIIGSAKSSEKRVTKALIIVRHLAYNKGKINHKLLSAQLQQSLPRTIFHTK